MSVKPFLKTSVPVMLIVLLAGSFSGCSKQNNSNGLNAPPVNTSVELSAGQQIFINNCSGCHGNGGNPPLPSADVMGSARLDTLDTFTRWVRQPETTMMPPFGEEKLSDADVKELYDYIYGLVALD